MRFILREYGHGCGASCIWSASLRFSTVHRILSAICAALKFQKRLFLFLPITPEGLKQFTRVSHRLSRWLSVKAMHMT